jgi:hypothetical protein
MLTARTGDAMRTVKPMNWESAGGKTSLQRCQPPPRWLREAFSFEHSNLEATTLVSRSSAATVRLS